MTTEEVVVRNSAESVMAYQRCHAIGHRWENVETVPSPPAYGVAMDLRCSNCGTVRRDTFSAVTGMRIGPPKYHYPEGYHDYERHDKNWWRAAFARSVFESARAYIDTSKETVTRIRDPKEDRRARTLATREWRANVARAQFGPLNPSPQPATTTRQRRKQ